MSSLFTALLGGNAIANSQAGSAAGKLNSGGQGFLGQVGTDNSNLANQQALYAQLFGQASANANSILGAPVKNADKLTGLATNKTTQRGDTQGVQTARYSLLGG